MMPVAVGLFFLPALAFGAESTRTILDFTKPGPLKSYFDLSFSVAWSYLPLAVVIAFALEALGHAPGTPRNFAAVVWRFVIILFLLWNYERVFGFVIKTTDDIADQLQPKDALDEFHKYMDAVYDAKPADAGTAAPEIAWATGDGKSGTEAPGRSALGNYVFDAMMGLLLFAAKGLVYALERLARILAAAFFILGPLALVAGIPRPSRTAEKWFHHFVTVAAWPIFSGVLLGVMTAVAKQSVANGAGTVLGNLVSAVVMGFCALAAPVLSGWIVGGAAQNLASLGHANWANVSARLSRTAASAQRMADEFRHGVARGLDGENGSRNAVTRAGTSAAGGGPRAGSGRGVSSNPP